MRRENCTDEEQTQHLIELGDRYRRRAEAHAEEFAENVANRQTGKSALDDDVVDRPSMMVANTSDDVPDEETNDVTSISRNQEVRLQHFAIISLIGDDQELDKTKQQPALLVWGSTETESAAKDLIKNELAEEAPDVHLDVVAMYEWLYPTAVDPEQIIEEYRDKRLDDLMQHRKTEKRRIASFRKKCADEGREAPLISLERPIEDSSQPSQL